MFEFMLVVEKIVSFLVYAVNIISLCIVINSVFKAVILQCKHEGGEAREKLTKGINTGLTFNLAGEVMKMIVVHEISELQLIGGILLLKVVISVLLHYEGKWHHEKELEQMAEKALKKQKKI